MKKRNLFLVGIVLFIILAAATVRFPFKKQEKISPHLIRKQIINEKYMEATPFSWKGEILYLLSERDDKNKSFYLSINRLMDNKLVSGRFGKGLSLAHALVDNGYLYVFGTENWTIPGESRIYMIQTDDLKKFSEPKLVYEAKEGQKIFNTSVTKNEITGEFVMAIESDEPGYVPFTINFLKSKDLNNWTIVDGAVYGKDAYVACPTLKFSDDYFYLLYGREFFYDPNCKECKTYITEVARSKNLIDWESSSYPFIMPLGDSKEGSSAADVDLAELKGVTHILYSISDQSTWGKIRYAIYEDTTSNLLDSFFPKHR